MESFLNVILRVFKHLGYNHAHILNIEGLSLDKEIDLKKGLIEYLPQSDEFLDFIVSTLSLHHWIKPINIKYLWNLKSRWIKKLLKFFLLL
mgnify:CR=1 FL=1